MYIYIYIPMRIINLMEKHPRTIDISDNSEIEVMVNMEMEVIDHDHTPTCTLLLGGRSLSRQPSVLVAAAMVSISFMGISKYQFEW